jgi:hypothetical protein
MIVRVLHKLKIIFRSSTFPCPVVRISQTTLLDGEFLCAVPRNVEEEVVMATVSLYIPERKHTS